MRAPVPTRSFACPSVPFADLCEGVRRNLGWFRHSGILRPAGGCRGVTECVAVLHSNPDGSFFYHNNGANLLMVDGHVEWRAEKDINPSGPLGW